MSRYIINYCRLKLLTYHEMELTLAISTIIKSISPINSEQTDYRQVNPHTHTGRPLNLKWIELVDCRPAISTLKECKYKYSRLWLKYHRISQLNREFVINISCIRTTA